MGRKRGPQSSLFFICTNPCSSPCVKVKELKNLTPIFFNAGTPHKNLLAPYPIRENSRTDNFVPFKPINQCEPMRASFHSWSGMWASPLVWRADVWTRTRSDKSITTDTETAASRSSRIRRDIYSSTVATVPQARCNRGSQERNNRVYEIHESVMKYLNYQKRSIGLTTVWLLLCPAVLYSTVWAQTLIGQIMRKWWSALASWHTCHWITIFAALYCSDIGYAANCWVVSLPWR